MAFPIVPRYRSGSAGNPTSLNLGELAVNTHDGSLYLGADVGVVQIGVPVAAGTELTEWTANGSASQFAPINGYNGTDPQGYLVTVQGIDQPFTVTSANGGTLVFDFTPTAGSVIRARAITQASGGGGGGGIPSADVQVFDTAGTFEWTKPADAKSVNIVCIGGGQGGGGGQYSDPDPAPGGKGGDGGGYSERTIDADSLAATESVVVGAGGAGVTSAVGGTGYPGGNSTFGSVCIAFGGGVNGNSLSPKSLGGEGGAGTGGNGGNAINSFAPGGGGGGGGFWLDQASGLGGSGATSSFGAGGAGSDAYNPQPGQDGGAPGGGGGGGGAAPLSIVAGPGGNGAVGRVIVTTYF